MKAAGAFNGRPREFRTRHNMRGIYDKDTHKDRDRHPWKVSAVPTADQSRAGGLMDCPLIQYCPSGAIRSSAVGYFLSGATE
jgi:hypothetical protein